MCGRFTLTASSYNQLALRFDIGGAPQFEYHPRYNIAPSQSVLAVITHEGERRLGPLRWGLIPFWAKEPAIGNKMINARSETVHEKPSFRSAFQRRRCLIPADGFFEWERHGYPPRQPYYLHLESGETFAFAGLWERWTPADGDDPIYSCTILTTDANALLQPIHPRMPVILPKEQEEAWLQSDDAEFLKTMLKPYPAEEMKMYPVSTTVNSPKNDREACITPL